VDQGLVWGLKAQINRPAGPSNITSAKTHLPGEDRLLQPEKVPDLRKKSKREFGCGLCFATRNADRTQKAET
jgi:hypothetical protein